MDHLRETQHPRPRSGSSKISVMGRQSRPIYVRYMYDIYNVNYTTRACVDAIAEDVAKLGHEWVRDENFPITPEQDILRDQAEMLMSSPNNDMSEHDLLTANTKDLLLGGDGYTEAVFKAVVMERSMGQNEVLGFTPIQFWPIEGKTVQIIVGDRTGKLPEPPLPAYSQLLLGNYINFGRNQIIHFTEGSIAGRLYGTPRLLSALILIANQTQALRSNLKTFTGQRYPKMMVNVGEMKKEDLNRLIAEADEQAEENPNGIIWLAANMANLLKLIDSNRDMEFMELLKFAERAICAVFKVPRIKLGISDAGGAGIVVGHTQMQAYWDNIEGIQKEISEKYNLFFRNVLGLRAYKLKLKNARPDLYIEQAQIQDIRIKNGSLTVNEERKERGLEAVPWGNEPPMTAPAPLLSNQIQDQNPTYQHQNKDVITGWPTRKAQAPGRQRNSPLADQLTEKIHQKTRSAMAGAWMRAKAEMLELISDQDIITQKQADGEEITSVEDLTAALDDILASWEVEATQIMADGNADSYSVSRTTQLRDIGVSDEVPAFKRDDAARLRDIQTEQAVNPIKTFRAEQKSIIEDAVASAYAEGIADTFEIRGRIEDNMRQLTTEETFKLDRIVRTSVGNAQRTARGAALTDSGLSECRVITANDSRVRPKHKALHNKVVPIKEALRILNEPNCRCRITKISTRPKTVPSPQDIAEAIRTQGADAQKLARESLEVE